MTTLDTAKDLTEAEYQQIVSRDRASWTEEELSAVGKYEGNNSPFHPPWYPTVEQGARLVMVGYGYPYPDGKRGN